MRDRFSGIGPWLVRLREQFGDGMEFLAQCDRLSANDTLKQMCQPLDEPIR